MTDGLDRRNAVDALILGALMAVIEMWRYPPAAVGNEGGEVAELQR